MFGDNITAEKLLELVDELWNQKIPGLVDDYGKDLIIKHLIVQVFDLKQTIQKLSEQIISLTKEKEVEYCNDFYNQDKISFCIEKLEKVKELLLIESKQNPIVYNVTNDVVGSAIDKNRCFKIIDNQIKRLKEVSSGGKK